MHEVVIEQRVEHNPGRLLNLGQYSIELLLSPHQRIDVLNRQYLGILRGSRAGNRGERLTGCIGYQMKMEIAAYTVRHRKHNNLWISVEEGHALCPGASPAVQLSRFFHIPPLGIATDAAGTNMMNM